MDQPRPTLTESALRGLACKCPRCGKGKIYSGFLTLAPRCEACGLDYAFMDSGDGPAIFMIMIAGAIVVGCASSSCSACENRSIAIQTASVSPSQITRISDGPAIMSMPTCPYTARLAVATQMLPGPTI